MLSLSDKLKSLGVKMGPGPAPPPRPRAVCPIEQAVPGRVQATPHGETFVVETDYPCERRHGPLRVTAPPQIIAEWARDPRLTALEPDTFAFLDTETTGLAGGAGTYAFLVGVGRCDGDRFRVTQVFMRDPAEEPALLAALSEFLRPCAALVTFNGKAFDAPLLNARGVVNRLPLPLTSLAHLDLLPLARRLWRDRLPSRALGCLETQILGVTRTGENVEGWMIPELYFDYLRTGDARPLKGVFYHNAMDVLAMAALFGHVARLLDDPLNVREGLDTVAMGRLLEDLGHLEAAAQLYERGLRRDLPEPVRGDAVRRLSSVRRRTGDLPAAVQLWREAARSREVYAHVELAKFYEHRQRDYREAERWACAALTLVEALPPEARGPWRAALEHRLGRLKRKTGIRESKISRKGQPMPPYRILFVCHGNIFRSAFAHHRLLALLADRRHLVSVRSAGTKARPGEPSPAVVLEGARAYGLDLSGHTSTPLAKDLLDWATHIYVMQDDMLDVVRGLSPDAAGRARLLGALAPDAEDTQVPDVGGDGSTETSVARRFARIDGLLKALIARELPGTP